MPRIAGFTPKIRIYNGYIRGYGGPGLHWTKGVFDNRRLYYVESTGESDVAIRGERERLKWEKRWPTEEAFSAAITKKKLDSPICSNCGNSTAGGGGSCLNRMWCDRPACREALDKARNDYAQAQERIKADHAAQRQQEKQDSIREIDKITQCFHLRDGWFFRREPDGSVRIMHRERPDSEWLSVDFTVDPDGWASIICSVSLGGETTKRWNAALEFHGSQVLA